MGTIWGDFMRFIYNENLTKDMVKRYYKKYEDIDGELEIICGSRKVAMAGRCFMEHEVPAISFRLKGSMEFEGETQPVEIALSEDEIENALTTMVEASGRKVKRVSINFDEKSFKSVVVEAVAKRKIK